VPRWSSGRHQNEGRKAALLGSPDRLAPFHPAVLAVRWSATVVSVALAAGAFIDTDLRIVPWVAVVVANTVARTVFPLEDDGSTRSLLPLLFEVGLHLLAVTATGYWDSPLVFTLVTAVIIAGFARGYAVALRIGLVSALAVSLPWMAPGWTVEQLILACRWTTVLLLVAIVAGYARRISGEASRQHSLTLDRLTRLADANALLFSLHRIAQTLPASLGWDEVLDSTMARLKGLVDHHGAGIILLDDTDGTWLLGRRQGMALDERYAREDLPDPARLALETGKVQLATDLSAGGPGFTAGHRSGVYAPLSARGHLIGLLAVEHREVDGLGQREREILQGFVEPVSLAIDNARWFSRLRTVSADEERTRIARDLHDRIGQSLAYLAFELDRIVRKNGEGGPVTEELAVLRNDLRGVIGEVRDTLYDLRTDVTEDKDFASVVEEFAGRLAERSGLEVDLRCDRDRRLPILQERELWRIAQEALVNVERHARAARASVTWRCNGSAAALEVTDDGIGFPVSKAGRLDSYGILGMRERASSIGATLDIISEPGEGTTVRCYLEHR
jgi:signal transduction histidine kinase